jgi:hypothetical protein
VTIASFGHGLERGPIARNDALMTSWSRFVLAALAACGNSAPSTTTGDSGSDGGALAVDGSVEDVPDVAVDAGPPPTIMLMTPPATGAMVSGTIVVRVRTSGSSVTVAQAGCPSQVVTSAPFRVEWDTTCDSVDGQKTITVTATTPTGASAVTTIQLTTKNARTSGQKTFPKGIVYNPSFGATPLTSAFFVTNTWIPGVSNVFKWSDVQPASNDAITSFSAFDTLMNISKGVNRTTGHPKVIFIVKSGGNSTPPWITGTPLFRPSFTAAQIPNVASESSLVPWDPVVSDYFVNFTAQIAAHYDDDPDFAGMYVAGVNAQYPEMIFAASSLWASITTTVDDPDPGLTNDASGAQLYASAWLRNVRLMATQFTRSYVINMLDATPAVPADTYGAFDAIYQHVNTTYASHATMGTANLGDGTTGGVVLTDKKYMVLDSSYTGALGANQTPVFYEIGPAKVNTSDPNSLANAIRKCAVGTGTGQLGCTAATIFNKSYYDSSQDAAAVAAASCAVWGGSDCP